MIPPVFLSLPVAARSIEMAIRFSTFQTRMQVISPECGAAKGTSCSLFRRTCLHGTFSKPEYDFARDLNKYHPLRPGLYSLTVMRNQRLAGGSRTGKTESPVLHITVMKP